MGETEEGYRAERSCSDKGREGNAFIHCKLSVVNYFDHHCRWHTTRERKANCNLLLWAVRSTFSTVFVCGGVLAWLVISIFIQYAEEINNVGEPESAALDISDKSNSNGWLGADAALALVLASNKIDGDDTPKDGRHSTENITRAGGRYETYAVQSIASDNHLDSGTPTPSDLRSSMERRITLEGNIISTTPIPLHNEDNLAKNVTAEFPQPQTPVLESTGNGHRKNLVNHKICESNRSTIPIKSPKSRKKKRSRQKKEKNLSPEKKMRNLSLEFLSLYYRMKRVSKFSPEWTLCKLEMKLIIEELEFLYKESMTKARLK